MNENGDHLSSLCKFADRALRPSRNSIFFQRVGSGANRRRVNDLDMRTIFGEGRVNPTKKILSNTYSQVRGD